MAFIIKPPPDFFGAGGGVASSAASAMCCPFAASLPHQHWSKFYAIAALRFFIVFLQ
jgi:hypothetical protein